MSEQPGDPVPGPDGGDVPQGIPAPTTSSGPSGSTGTPARDVPIVSVTGGSEGTAAHYAEMRALAASYEQSGRDLLDQADLGAHVLANGDLLESSILSPGTFAQAEGAVVQATTGPNGLTVRALSLEVDGFLLRTTVDTYVAADDLRHAAFEALDYGTGFVLGLGAPWLAVAGAGYLATLSPAEKDRLMAQLNAWGEDHPGVLEHLVNGGGGLLDGLRVSSSALLTPFLGVAGGPVLWGALGFDPFHPDTGSAAKDIAALYDDGEPRLSDPVTETSFAATQAPNNVSDLMSSLRDTNASDNADGYIRIESVQVDGHTKYIAYLPGTDDMGTKPFGSDDTIRDMGANLRLMGGDDTAYGRGIVEALNRATAGDPNAHVMLVGHSQGGMTAAEIASLDKDSGAHFTVDHVVTAGSPNSQIVSLPSHTDMLSLENNGDAVPLTDGEPNPDAINRTTVRFDSPTGSIGDNHSMDRYFDGAAAVDKAAGSTYSGSLHDAVRSLDDYFGGTHVKTESVIITRTGY